MIRKVMMIIFIISFLSMGCSNTKNMNEQTENTNNLPIEGSAEQNITFKELQSIAVNNLGKGSDIDGKSNYVTYSNDTIHDRITVNTTPQETFPDISQLSEDKFENDMKKIRFLSSYYEFVKKEYDNFADDILTKDVTQADFYKLIMKYRDFIHSRYIEGESKQAITTYFYITLALSKEEGSISDMINVKNDNLSKSEKRSRINEENDIRLESRDYSDTNIKNVYNKIEFN
ncbi:hypothetical protein [Terrisporobacter vanillatitrophus]|uniref:hypothetical protein n=1 Tax=Terrisporobacter vanillatitrophus TaxID=3058402 RepID=UPI003368D92E